MTVAPATSGTGDTDEATFDVDGTVFSADGTVLTPSPAPRRRRTRRRVLLAVGLALAVVAGGAGYAGYRMVRRVPDNLGRVEGAFDGLVESQRPTKPQTAAGTLNVLLVGSDSRSPEPTTGRDAGAPVWTTGAQRSDAIMLLHFSADRRTAAVVSIPRDSWEPIEGVGTTKINAAYSYGGPPLLISTVERLTSIRIDHFAVVDFAGLRSVVDTVGGVDIRLARAARAGRYQLAAGLNHLDGDEALAYVRERRSLYDGEFDRTRRHQNLLRAIMAKVARINPAHDPVQTYRLLDAATKSVSVDDTLTGDEMRTLAMSLLGLRTDDVAFLNAPYRYVNNAEPSPEGPLTAVHLDKARCDELWRALREDTAAAYVAAHRSDLLPATPH